MVAKNLPFAHTVGRRPYPDDQKQFDLPFTGLVQSRLLNSADRKRCFEWVRDNEFEVGYIHFADSLEHAIWQEEHPTANGVSSVMFRFIYLEDAVLFRLMWSDR